jgi:hypothetical protein
MTPSEAPAGVPPRQLISAQSNEPHAPTRSRATLARGCRKWASLHPYAFRYPLSRIDDHCRGQCKRCEGGLRDNPERAQSGEAQKRRQPAETPTQNSNWHAKFPLTCSKLRDTPPSWCWLCDACLLGRPAPKTTRRPALPIARPAYGRESRHAGSPAHAVHGLSGRPSPLADVEVQEHLNGRAPRLGRHHARVAQHFRVECIQHFPASFRAAMGGRVHREGFQRPSMLNMLQGRTLAGRSRSTTTQRTAQRKQATHA